MKSDEVLYREWIAGDLSAFDVLYARYELPLFGFIRGQLGDGHEAEDLFHDAFMAVLRERRRDTELHCFKAWLYQVARHLCLNRVRSRKSAGRGSRVEEDRWDSGPRSADEELEQCEQSLALRRAVERLPPALAEVYQLRAAGLSFEQLAQVLDIPIGTAKSRAHEMIKRLREELQP